MPIFRRNVVAKPSSLFNFFFKNSALQVQANLLKMNRSEIAKHVSKPLFFLHHLLQVNFLGGNISGTLRNDQP